MSEVVSHSEAGSGASMGGIVQVRSLQWVGEVRRGWVFRGGPGMQAWTNRTREEWKLCLEET